MKRKLPPAKSDMDITSGAAEAYTPRQGQFLAFIHLYRKLHRRGPAETDLIKFFRVTPPAVHDMIVRLEKLGMISREPGVALIGLMGEANDVVAISLGGRGGPNSGAKCAGRFVG